MSLYLGTNLISGVATPVEGARNIGQIVQSAIPLSDAGLHLLDGALISGSGSYADFVTYISNLDLSASYFCTEAEWQTSVTTYGVCGKFVYDSVNNTVRLPKYSNKIYTKDINSAASVIGTGITLGVTDGTVNAGTAINTNSNNPTWSMQTTMYGSNVGTTASGTWLLTGKTIGITTDPTKSGMIADLSNITTALEGYWYIVIASSVKTDIEVDIDEIATDLNGKADVDLTNCTKPHIVETYVNGTSWYRLYSDGWCEQGGQATKNTYNVSFLLAFKDTNYNIVANHASSNTTLHTIVGNKTVTGFTIQSGQYNDRRSSLIVNADWRACGYIN